MVDKQIVIKNVFQSFLQTTTTTTTPSQIIPLPSSSSYIPLPSSTISTIFTWFHELGLSLYRILIITPLARLYLKGPSYLFWGNLPLSHICSFLTKTTVDFWEKNDINREECVQMVSNHFNTYLIVLETLVYFFLFYLLLKLCLKTICAVVSGVFNNINNVGKRKKTTEIE